MKTLPPPSLLVYLKAPVNILIKRIQSRGRKIETGITSEYLTLLENYYDEWVRSFDLCPVLTLRTDNLDFVHKSEHMDTVVARIRGKICRKRRDRSVSFITWQHAQKSNLTYVLIKRSTRKQLSTPKHVDQVENTLNGSLG